MPVGFDKGEVATRVVNAWELKQRALIEVHDATPRIN